MYYLTVWWVRNQIDLADFYRSHQAKIMMSVSLISSLEAQGGIHFQAHSGSWQSADPCSCRAEISISLLALGQELFPTSGGLLHSLAPCPFHPGASHSGMSTSHAHSCLLLCCISLTPAREFFLFLRTCVIRPTGIITLS